MAAFVIVSVTQSTFYLVMTAFILVASLFFLFLSTPVQDIPDFERFETTLLEDIKETWDLLISRQMIKLWLLMAWTAVNGSGIQAGVMVPLMTNSMKANLLTSEWSEE